MKINLSWDSSVSGAPAGFKADVQNAAAQLDAAILNPVTVTIQVGWNEIGGTPMTPGSGGLGGPSGVLANNGYGSVAQINASSVSSLNTQLALNATGLSASMTGLPSGTMELSTAQAQAMGISYASGSVGYSSSANVDGSIGLAMPGYSTNADMIQAALHELAHALGRINGSVDASGNTWLYTLDLFTYSAPGVLWTPSSTTAGYFSLDGGKTNLGNFSTQDSADFVGSIIGPFSYGGYGINTLTALDRQELQTLGFAVVTQSITLPTNDSVYVTPGTAYTGTNGDTVTYSGPESQYTVNAALLPGTVTVQDTVANRDGASSLTGVARLAFSNGMVAFDLGANQSTGQAAELVNAVFGSGALTDQAMMGEWINFFDHGGTMVQAAHLLDGVMGAGNSSFVSQLWQDVMGSPIDPINLATYTNDLTNGTYSKSSLLAAAATTSLNQTAANLSGLATTGVNFDQATTTNGITTLSYNNPSANYLVNSNLNSSGVVTVSGSGSTDTLVDVQRIRFTDGSLALDLGVHQSAGEAVLLLNAAMGPSALSNQTLLGEAIGFFDGGGTLLQGANGLLDTRMVSFASNSTFVSTVWQNVVGSPIDAADLASFTNDLQHGGVTQASLMALVATTAINQATVNLVGLASHGVLYA
ncbi:NF038122 family metalloprotease [Ferrovum sp.]|uniref:NF038122 family metalloprotease n=1 Tax=Ferrovum sp. TaxID=2609467 RepID=UPI00262A9AE1|nr:NF038122 family metalloprotease [Ferrovum sp.]